MGRNRRYDIADFEGNSFQIVVDVQYIRSSRGSWHAVDRGFIRYHSGGTIQSGSVFNGSAVLHMLLPGTNNWIIQLDDFEDYLGVNSQGTGTVIQSAVLGLVPGTISWNLA